MRPRAFVGHLALLLVFESCTPAHTLAARAAAASGQPERALTSWQARLSELPTDAEALEGLHKARRALLERALQQASTARAAERWSQALEALQRAFVFVFGEVDRRDFDIEQLAVAAAIDAATQSLLDVDQPFSAHRLVAGLSRDLHATGLDVLTQKLLAKVRVAAARRCAAISPLARTAWLASVVRRACAPLGATTPAPTVAPETRAGLVVDASTLATSNPEVRASLTDSLRQAFVRSAWADPRADGTIDSQVTGRIESRLTATPLELTATWSTTEPYQTTESQTEYYTESYTATESYTYSCASSTGFSTSCMGTRTVTRTRPATRTVQKSVTKYRTVWHSRTYPGVQKRIEHRAALALAVALPGTAHAVELLWEDSVDKTDVEHSTLDREAGVTPHAAELPSERDWAVRQSTQLVERASVALAKAWADSFCSVPLKTPDAAARCLAGAPAGDWPEARLSLARFLGEPESFVAGLVREPVAAEPPLSRPHQRGPGADP